MIRVTTILDYLTEPELLNWFLKNSRAKCKAISDEALKIGTEVDLLVRQDIQEGGYLIQDEEGPISLCMKAWEAFKRDFPKFTGEVKDLQKELVLGDLMGHPDFICNRGNQWGIVDLKCSAAIRPRYWTQCAAYAMLLGLDLNNMYLGILRLDKKSGIYEYKEVIDKEYIEYEISIFKAYKLAYYHNERNREQMRLALEKDVLNVS